MTRGLTGILVGLCLLSVGITAGAILYTWQRVTIPGIPSTMTLFREPEIKKESFGKQLEKRIKQVLCPSDLTSQDAANVLVAGIDGILAPGRKARTFRTDSIHLVRFYPKAHHAAVLSLPRDLRVRLGKRHGYDKINAAYVYGGKDLLLETINHIFAESEPPLSVDKYLILNLEAFIHVVDEFGGIDLDVEKRMKYKDNWGGLDINLQPGFQHLDGRQAMGYVRFRKDRTGDLGRIVRQQKFATEFIKQTSGFRDRIKLKGVFDDLIAKGDLQTDMGFCDFMAMKDAFEGEDLDHRLMPIPMPAVDDMISGISYLLPSAKSIKEISSKVFSQDPTRDFLEMEPLKLVNSCPAEDRGNFLKALLRANGVRFSAVERRTRKVPAVTTVYGPVSDTMRQRLSSFFTEPVIFEDAPLPWVSPPPGGDISASIETPDAALASAPALVLGSDACRGL